jgi:hypothetical protein
MNRTDLEARYALIRPLAGEGSQTHLARSGTGAIVMVHFLPEAASSWRDGILTRLDQVAPDRRDRFIEVLDVDGRAVVVTRFLMDFRSFPDWLGEAEAESSPSEAATDEFERLFGRSAAPPLDALPHEGTSPAEVVAEVDEGPPPPAAARPGFDLTPPTEGSIPALRDPNAASAEPPRTPPSPEAPPAATPALDPPAAQPGEFTRVFGAAPPPSDFLADAPAYGEWDAEPLPPLQQPPSESGEADTARSRSEEPRTSEPWAFTREPGAAHPPADREAEAPSPPSADGGPSAPPAGPPHGGPPPLVPPAAPPSPAAPADAAVNRDAEPGEFTRMFRAVKPPPDVPGHAQPFASAPEPPPEAPAPPPPSATAPADEVATAHPNPPASEPGEFTRMFRAAHPPADSLGEGSASGSEAARETAAPAPPASPADAVAKAHPNPPASEPGEFTRMFRAANPPADRVGEAPASTSASATPPEAPAPPPPAPPAPPADAVAKAHPNPTAAEPGEFTRMFRAANPPANPAGRPGPPLRPSQLPATGRPQEPSGPGEFTRTFAAANPPPPPTEPPGWAPLTPAPGSHAPADPGAPAGEFTQMFQKLGGTPPPPASSPASPASPGEPLWPPAGAAGNDGYRDRLFGDSLVPPPPEAAPPPGPQEPPRVRVDPELPPLPAHMAPPTPPPPPSAGEYTRMIAAQARPAEPAPVPSPLPPPAAPPGALPPPAPPRAPRIGVVIGLTVVVLATLALIVFLVTRAGMNPAPAGDAPADTLPVAGAPAAAAAD